MTSRRVRHIAIAILLLAIVGTGVGAERATGGSGCVCGAVDEDV